MNRLGFICTLWLCLGAGSGFAQNAASLPSSATASAYSISLTGGRTIPAMAIRRDGDNVMASQVLPAAPGSAPVVGQVGYPVKAIKSIEFPKPPELEEANKLLAAGKAAEALSKITPAVDFAAKFSDIPGNRWTELALAKLGALTRSENSSEAEALAARLMKTVSDPEIMLSARVQIAAGWVRAGQCARALPVFDEVIQESESDETLATAWLNKGNALMANHEAEAALLAYLRVPVLHPGQTLLIPPALMGSVKAYQAMGDTVNASRAKQDLVNLYPGTPEAAAVKADAPNN